jgi:TonB family protein
MHMQDSTTELARPQVGLANQQPRRLLIALVILLVALGVVLVKDRDFWFPSDEASEPEAVPSQDALKTAPAKTVATRTVQAPAVRVAVAKNQVAPKTSTQAVTNPASPAVSTTRAVLPPLDVEVIAGDTHRNVHPGSNVTNVQIPGDSNRASATASAATLPKNAAESERLSTGTVPELRQTVDANYPLLGQHMSVQGSVVLQAVVGVDGSIEDLRVISGPAILTTAAQQAVRQWRFKPYLQNGQPVETKARITVNFSIRISDNPPKTS